MQLTDGGRCVRWRRRSGGRTLPAMVALAALLASTHALAAKGAQKPRAPAPASGVKPASAAAPARAAVKAGGGKGMVGTKKQDAEYGDAARHALKIARFHYKKGNFVQCAQMFHQAYGLQPRVEFLFNAARCEQRAMKLDLAEKHFEACLKVVNAPQAVSRRARLHLGEIKSTRIAIAKARNEGMASARVATRKQPRAPHDAWKRPTGWASVGVGALLLGAGAWLAVSYASGQSALDEKTGQTNAAGQITGVTWAAYETEQTRLNGQAAARSGLIAGGAVVAGAGIWMLLTANKTPQRAALVPMGSRQVGILVRF